MDYWSLGVILYEFLVGVTPFYGDSVSEVFEMILTGMCTVFCSLRRREFHNNEKFQCVFDKKVISRFAYLLNFYLKILFGLFLNLY